jgi:Tfp pilus assembly protein PilP
MRRRKIFITVFASVVALAGWAQARVVKQPAQNFTEPGARLVRARNIRGAPVPSPTPTPTPEAEASPTAAPPDAATAAPASTFSAAGKRDPFRSVIQSHDSATSDCAAGKKCLVAGLLILKGVVKGPDGMLAVVENQHHKSYFLRERDPIFNGQVVHITPDSIVFREKVVDKAGHETMHEVVKHIAGGKPVV